MSVYYEIFLLQIKKLFHYRITIFLSTIFDPIIMLLYISLLESIYANSPDKIILGYSCTQMIWYFGATKFFYYLVWSTPDKEISDQIITGRITNTLILPISFMKWTITWVIASKVVSFVLEFLPSFLVFSILTFPDFLTLEAFLKYMALSGLSFLLFFYMSFIIGTMAFSWQSTASLESLKLILITIIAGAAIPIEFFPKAFQLVLDKLPFQYLCYKPIQFFLNKPEYQSMSVFYNTALIQLMWIGVFYFTAKIFWRSKIKNFIAVGG